MGKPKTPDARQAAYIDKRSKGVGTRESAVLAGYNPNSSTEIERSKTVQGELAKIRLAAANDAGVTRDDIIRGFMSAAQLAATLDDPTGMVAAWRELGKLLGHYAPEVKKVEKGINKRDLQKAFDTMTDAELQQLARGRPIDGEFKHVTDDGGASDAQDLSKVPQERPGGELLQEGGGLPLLPDLRGDADGG